MKFPTPPPCAGLWAIFDSTEPDDHLRARQICGTCNVVTECRRELEEQCGTTMRRPVGTWAGKLIGGATPKRRPDCGTTTGYRSHRHHGEKPCRPCLDAETQEARERRQRRPVA